MNSFKVHTVKSWLFDAKERLLESQKANNLNTINVRLDAEILLLKALNKSRNFIYTDSDYILAKEELENIESLLSRRLKGEPIAYITGNKEFWSLDFKVTPDVLIPRPETELIIEKVLEKLPKDKNLNIADIGTGSGVIAVSLAKERPNWTIHAVDLSDEALKIAKENAKKHNIKNIVFYHADLFSGFNNINLKFDAIVSNPPYIDINDEYITDVNKEELKYEPLMALVAENNGMAIIEKLILDSSNYLAENGFLIFEHGYKQKNDIESFAYTQKIINIEFIKDFNQLDRVVILKLT